MEDKKSFISQAPFACYKRYVIWFKLTMVLVSLLLLTLGAISWYNYNVYQGLLLKKNTLFGSVSQLDEIVRKKNKLLSQHEKSDKYNNKRQGVHTKIADFLVKIEAALVPGVYLNSFEYALNKIELVGYSDCIENLSRTISNLKKLSFVKDHDIEQLTKNTKVANHKLAFTITINL